MGTVEVNDVELFYEEYGSGPPLLLVHGTGGYADLWAPVIEALATTHRVIAYDRRGFGRSTPRPARRLADHVRDLGALLKVLDASPATVVGWSGGGVIALEFAIASPKQVTGLVLAEAAVHLLTHPTRSALVMQARSAAQRYLRRDTAAAAAEMYRWASGSREGGNTFDVLPEEWRERMLRNGPSTVREMDQLMKPRPSRAAIRSIACPVTVIEGDLSDRTFRASDDFQLDLMPQSRRVVLPGAAHFLHIDQPELWVEALTSI